MFRWYTIRGQRSVTSTTVILPYSKTILNRQSYVSYTARLKFDFHSNSELQR